MASWLKNAVGMQASLHCGFRVCFLPEDDGCAVALLAPREPRFIHAPFPLLQGLIVLGEASPPDPAADDASRPMSADVKLEPGAERLVSAAVRGALHSYPPARWDLPFGNANPLLSPPGLLRG